MIHALSKLSLKRPVSVFMIVIALVFFSLMAFTTTPMELIPDIEMPMLVIATPYPGASPEDVEDLVTAPVEDALGTITGVKNIMSTSMENFSMVMLELEYGTNMEESHSDVKNNIDIYATSLPEDAGDPTIIEIGMSMMPTITLSATATGDIDLPMLVNDVVAPELERQTGVASVSVSGGGSQYIQVELDEERMNQYHLSIASIAQIISAADFTMPIGTLSQNDVNMTIRGGISYPTAESLRDIPITLATGDIIHLSDVANITYRDSDSSSFSRYNGNENMSITVSKRQSASTLTVTKAVTRVVEDLNAQDLGFELGVIYDASQNILDALSSLGQAMFYGIVLSMLVLFIFFGDWRASLIVGTSIPVSLLATICAMSAMDFTFNLMSLGGLVVGVGMMVDNSIVVIESCFRMREGGRSLKESAIEGAGVVGQSVFASTLTTVVVFLPIATLEGMSGELFGQLCFTIVFALISSLISAVTLAPLVFYRMAPVEHEFKAVTRVMNKLYSRYSEFLPKTFRHKKLVVLAAVAMLVLSFAMVPFIGVELLPATDEGTIEIAVETRPGLSVDVLNEKVSILEDMVAAHPDVDRYSLSAGGSGITAMMGGSGGSATLTAYLKGERALTTGEIVDQWRAQTADILDCEISISSYSTTAMMTGGADVSISLEADNFDSLREASSLVVSTLETNPYIVRASSAITAGTPQAEIMVDPVKAAANGLVPASVMGSIYTMISGQEAMTLTENGKDYSVVVEFPKDRFETVNDLHSLMVMAPSGRQIPLFDIAEIRYSDSPQSITRLNGMYQLSITGQKTSDAPTTLSRDLNEEVEKLALPAGVRVAESSMDEQIRTEFTNLFRAMLIAAFLVFMVMTMQFESPRFSLIVMFSIPFSMIGAFGALLLSGSTLTMPSLMGFLMLIGTVVNNGILFVDTTNQMRSESGIPAEDALLQSGILRMRPIFMTTLTTVLAQVPMAVSSSGNGALMSGMAWVIIGGLLASTILILLLLPTFYLLFGSKLTPEEKERRHEEKLAAREKRERERVAAKNAH